MDAFAIPVVFLVEGADERAAAETLAGLLEKARLTQDHRRRQQELAESVFGCSSRKDLGPIESWWTPNHRGADGGDEAEQVLVWRPGSDDVSEVPAVLEAYATSAAYHVVRMALPEGIVYRHADVAPIAAWLADDPGFRAVAARLAERLREARLTDGAAA